MSVMTSNIQEIVDNIINVIKMDDQLTHCRVNIVNGCSDVFQKYKNNLSDIQQTKQISVRFYENFDLVTQDLFYKSDAMSPTWFNLFVFNLNYCKHICQNPSCQHFNLMTMECDQPTYCLNSICADASITVKDQLMSEIRYIASTMQELRERFDSKYFAGMIVSMLPQKVIHNAFEEFTGKECPVKSLRYLDFNFEGDEILTYLYKILKTHSTEFLTQWSNVIQKLEEFSKKDNIKEEE